MVFNKANSRYPVFPHMNESTTRSSPSGKPSPATSISWLRAGVLRWMWSLLNEQRRRKRYAYVPRICAPSIPGTIISTSWDDHVNMTQIEIDSVHWYYSKAQEMRIRQWLA